MKHGIKFRSLNRTEKHRRCLFKTQVTQLMQHERIETTVAKAKELRRYADKIITLGKRGDLKSVARVHSYLRTTDAARKVCVDLSKRFATREGGYTRLLKTRFRRGDCAPMAFVELSETENTILTKAQLMHKEERKTKHRRKRVEGLAQVLE